MTEDSLVPLIGKNLGVRLDARTGRVDHVGVLTTVQAGCADFGGRVYAVSSIVAVEPFDDAPRPETSDAPPRRRKKRSRRPQNHQHRRR